jgi:DNA-directed RNA polymerase specialized sigma subunit
MKEIEKKPNLDDLIKNWCDKYTDDPIPSTDALAHTLNTEISDTPNLQSIGNSVEEEIINHDERSLKDNSKDQKQLKKLLKVAEKILTEQEYEILIARWLGQSETTIAATYNLTQPRVNKILSSSRTKLKDYFSK